MLQRRSRTAAHSSTGSSGRQGACPSAMSRLAIRLQARHWLVRPVLASVEVETETCVHLLCSQLLIKCLCQALGCSGWQGRCPPAQASRLALCSGAGADV